jgi:hypothetical protein
MNTKRISTRSVNVSVVIQVLDEYTAKAPVKSKVVVFLTNMTKAPVRKENEYFIFTDLLLGDYELNILSNLHFPIKAKFSISSSMAVQQLVYQLKPRIYYRIPDRATAFTFKCKKNKTNASGVIVQAHFLSPTSSVAKVKQPILQKSSVIRLECNGKLIIGDVIRIFDRKKNYTTINKIIDITDHDEFHLETPVNGQFERGSLVTLDYETISDELGQVLIIFRKEMIKPGSINVSFYDQEAKKTITLEALPETVTHYGIIYL